MKKVIFVLVMILCAGMAYAGSNDEPLEITSLPELCESIGVINPTKCMNDPRIRSFGCDALEPPEEFWGGLKPYRAMAVCLEKGQGDSVRMAGCKIPMRVRYIVLNGEEKTSPLKMVESAEAFRRYFTPIETREEALSYVASVTGTYPVYSFPAKYFIVTPDENGEYLEKNPKPTEVTESKKGFLVRLFSNPRCGCFRPHLRSMEYFVTPDGYVELKKEKVVWEAHRLYEVCVD